MKTPMPPPDGGVLLDEAVRSGRIVELLARDVVHPQQYLTWDELRQRVPPHGWNHHEWWLAVRLRRDAARREIPLLRQKSGVPFTYVLPDQVLMGVDAVNRQAGGQIAISEQVTNAQTRDRYIVSSLIEEAIMSSQLEGATTSRRVAKDMLQSGRAPRTLSERMILNNYRVMQQVREAQGEKLTPELVAHLHRIVTDGTLQSSDSAGRIQSDQAQRVSVWGDGDQLLHRPPPVEELPGRLEALCEFANQNGGHYMPPVLRSIALHFMMGYDHYFEDGNGRTARAVFYWSMLHHGYWLAEFLTISRILKKAPAQYARSFLNTEQDGGDLTYFFIYHLAVIQRAIDELHRYLGQKAEELRAAEAELRAVPGECNGRQLAAVRRALRDEAVVFTAASHAAAHGVTQETARTDLLELEAKGYLERFKIGRKYAWRPAPDVAARVRGEG